MESDHRGCLTDIYLAECFAEYFAEDDEMFERSINPNRKTHRDKFADKCNKMLDSTNIERELNEVNGDYDHAKIEQIESDVTHVLMKTHKSAEGDVLRTDTSSEQRKLRENLAY